MEAVGFDSTEVRVYLRVEPHGGSGERPYLVYLDLDSPDPCRPTPLGWSRGESLEDYTRDPKWAQLAKHLAPVPLELAGSLPTSHQIVAVDTLRTVQGQWPRYRVRISGVRYAWIGQAEVVTYVYPAVHFLRVHRLPGKMGRLAILAFRGIPDEEGYECHVPLLLDFDCTDAPIEWRPR